MSDDVMPWLSKIHLNYDPTPPSTYNGEARLLRELDVTYPCDLTPEFWEAAQNWPWAPVRSTLPALRPSRFPRRPIKRPGATK